MFAREAFRQRHILAHRIVLRQALVARPRLIFELADRIEQARLVAMDVAVPRLPEQAVKLQLQVGRRLRRSMGRQRLDPRDDLVETLLKLFHRFASNARVESFID